MMKYSAKHKIYLYAMSLIVPICTSSCALLERHDYVTPQIDLPQQWQNQAEPVESREQTNRFWENFQDPLLNQLIEQVVEVNNDIRVAAVKVQRARLEAGITRSDLYPTPTLSAAASTQRDLERGKHEQTFSISGGLNYEVDLWNKYSASYDASLLEADATAADYRSARLSLIKTTAHLYWQIAHLNQLIASNGKALHYAEKSLELIKSRYHAGETSAAEVIQGQQDLLNSQTTLEQNRQLRCEVRHAFSLLFDQAPQLQQAELGSLADSILPAINPGLPTELLQSRPDLNAAELRLRKTCTQVAITRRSYLPSFSLTGALGSSSNQLKEILNNPLASFGADLALPFIQWDLTKRKIAVAESDYAEAIINFRQTLFTALSEVENALSLHSLKLNQQQRLAQNLTLARQNEQLAQVRYLSGAVALQVWLDAQELVRVAEVELSDNRLIQLQNMMTLYLALGGNP